MCCLLKSNRLAIAIPDLLVSWMGSASAKDAARRVVGVGRWFGGSGAGEVCQPETYEILRIEV